METGTTMVRDILTAVNQRTRQVYGGLLRMPFKNDHSSVTCYLLKLQTGGFFVCLTHSLKLLQKCYIHANIIDGDNFWQIFVFVATLPLIEAIKMSRRKCKLLFRESVNA